MQILSFVQKFLLGIEYHFKFCFCLILRLGNGPDIKKESNNSYEHVQLECKKVLTLLLSVLYF